MFLSVFNFTKDSLQYLTGNNVVGVSKVPSPQSDHLVNHEAELSSCRATSLPATIRFPGSEPDATSLPATTWFPDSEPGRHNCIFLLNHRSACQRFGSSFREQRHKNNRSLL
ncbi:hypothetical protein PoB_005408900 [Plakobranchus ocellatus]|uniref:Uncharacterized protein n=1 Tax=Plakobranchus ocellatus TaxID=259542 RepID=A0AAV4CA52_9GAST|nr:hypothetical protein PoB_005408900 [Plakobranchus ocellatus]